MVKKVPFGYIPTPEDVESGEQVMVGDSTEKWSEFHLEDGATIRVKTSVVTAVKLKDKVDDKGNAIYVVNLTPMISIVPAKEDGGN